ncbi:Histone H2B type 1 [Myotis brandtii]|uniref:Histone H2B type 1 n=1 Tax=Myotis brandtii TaxID=109478 RepID=S7MWQ2_MYOBR|nr:PREDICTED: histone H2B type 1 [Myotis brandtii]EPQ07930.1 Histone H2B type 1 [Myotis brandtii]
MDKAAKSAPAPKKGSSAQKKDSKKRKRSRQENYSVYVYKVLKGRHPNTGISSKAMGIMNPFLKDMFEHIAGEASRLGRQHGHLTITIHDIRSAVRLVLPQKLAEKALQEGMEAVTKYNSQ